MTVSMKDMGGGKEAICVEINRHAVGSGRGLMLAWDASGSVCRIWSASGIGCTARQGSGTRGGPGAFENLPRHPITTANEMQDNRHVQQHQIAGFVGCMATLAKASNCAMPQQRGRSSGACRSCRTQLLGAPWDQRASATLLHVWNAGSRSRRNRIDETRAIDGRRSVCTRGLDDDGAGSSWSRQWLPAGAARRPFVRRPREPTRRESVFPDCLGRSKDTIEAASGCWPQKTGPLH